MNSAPTMLLLAAMTLSFPLIGKQPKPTIVPLAQVVPVSTNVLDAVALDDVAGTPIVVTSSNYITWLGGSWDSADSQDRDGTTKTVWERSDGFQYLSVRPTPRWVLTTVRATNYSANPGTLAEHYLTNLWARTNLQPNLFTSTTDPDWVRNTNCSLTGLKGLTAVSARNFIPGYYAPGVSGYNWAPWTAITRRHCVTAAHQAGAVSGTGGNINVITTNWAPGTSYDMRIRWVTTSNTIVDRTIKGKLIGTSDTAIVVLNADLPPEIDVMRVWAINHWMGLGTWDYGDPPQMGDNFFLPMLYPHLNDVNYGGIVDDRFLPIIARQNKLLPIYICQHWCVPLGHWSDGGHIWDEPPGWTYGTPHVWPSGGDSGSPMFYVVGGELFWTAAMSSGWGYSERGESTDFMQHMINRLSVWAGLNPANYQMEAADLSAWPAF